jgi:hypothetical protein
VPREETVRLSYASRTWADGLGLLLSLAALLVLVLPASRRRFEGWRGGPALPEAAPDPTPGRRWGGVLPLGILLLLVAARFFPPPGGGDAALAEELGERASKAYAAEAFEAAAEYALQALGIRPSGRPTLRRSVPAYTV